MEKYRRESFLLTSAHEIVPRSYDIDELCIEFICRKKQLIDHIPMVEINVQLLLALFYLVFACFFCFLGGGVPLNSANFAKKFS